MPKLIRGLRPMLARFLQRFDDCFSRKDTRAASVGLCEWPAFDLQRKSVRTDRLGGRRARANFAGVSQSGDRWQEDLPQPLAEYRCRRTCASMTSVGIIDETSFVKQGRKTPGVQRQYLGTLVAGKRHRHRVFGLRGRRFSIACSMVSCSCRKVGLPIPPAVGRRKSRRHDLPTEDRDRLELYDRQQVGQRH